MYLYFIWKVTEIPIVPSNGFIDLTIEEYKSVLIESIVASVQQSFNNLGDMTVFKVYETI